MSRLVNTINRLWIPLLIFFLLLVNYVYFLPRWADWGQNARLNLVFSVVDQGTLSIDDYYENTGDYAFFEGHHYMDKAPGPSFLGIPVYFVIKPVLHLPVVENIMQRIAGSSAFEDTLNEEGSGLLEDKIYFAIVQYILVFIVIAVPSAFLGVLIFLFLQDLGLSTFWSLIYVLIYGLATNAFTYAGSFNSHQLTAALLFGAFFLGFQMGRKTLRYSWAIPAGFFLAYSVISEYPTALIAAGIFIYILYQLPDWGRRIAFVSSGLLPGALLIAYNLRIFHTPWPVGYEYSELYTDLHSTGFLSLTYPHLDALWGITFGTYRGQFFVAPILLVAFLGLILWGVSRKHFPEWLVASWTVLSFLLFNSSSVMWQGGYAVGPRYLVPMLPFVVIGFSGLPKGWLSRIWYRIFLGLLTAWSLFVVWVETLGGQSYPDWTANPLFNYSLPNFIEGDIARNLAMVTGLRGILSILPLLFFNILLITVLFILEAKTRKNKNESSNPV